ncbi:endopeptidase La [Candidatus Babeliales bacterium]|nr:endopeptidase La [Candidatus Babeliales bacterium]MBP9843447.1 endopeptidase La [Candidatus Babeliales bacterium]
METNIKNNAMKEIMSQTIPVVPAIDVIVFPHMIVPLLVVDERIIQGVNQALSGQKLVLLLSAKSYDEEHSQEVETENLYRIGTVASIMRVINVPEGGIKILIQGMCRAIVETIQTNDGILTANIKSVEFSNEEDEETTALIKNIKEISGQLSMTSQSFSPDFHTILTKMQNPEKIAEFILSHLDLETVKAQELLEQTNLNSLLEGIYQELHKEISVAQVQERIRNHTRDAINKSQNEFYLREQLKSIKKELGEHDEDFEVLREEIEAKPLPEKIKAEMSKQLNKLERISPDSMEASVTRNHIEWVLSLPWGIHTKDNLDITHAKQVLDEDHHGLAEIKERILDFISVKNLKQNGPSPILCFTGAPGVGKTSLGKSIARALGRNFFRISLGGVKDESEMRGHRRTYVGAMPGRFIQGMKKAKSMNPVILIDELDKLGSDFRGDPSAAMLEILDPQQNTEFYDNYLGIPFDLSNVLFIATSNDISAISAPLRDRMEIIELSGYTTQEKVSIAKNHLVHQAIAESGLNQQHFQLSEPVIEDIINGYTRESGVRNLSQQIKKLCSKAARIFVEKQEIISITNESLEKHLGPKRFVDELVHIKNMVGITNGLAWTSFGGEVLKIEALMMPGSGKLILTGQLGDVMKESAQAAMSYARSHAAEFHINEDRFTKFDLHIHVPAGAVPKDGPSAGITMLTSILSALTNRPIDASFAMTGELNLRGDVMPIGGVKEKLLAAKRNHMTSIILPEQNRNDYATIKEFTDGINVIWVSHANEVLDKVLLPSLI